MVLRALSLCAGIGGLDLGLRSVARCRTVGYVERDPYAAAVLVARMEEAALDPAPLWDDVATFDGRPWRGAVDLVLAGYPCQPFSVAGSRRGVADPRHLWPQIARIITAAEVGAPHRRERLFVLADLAGERVGTISAGSSHRGEGTLDAHGAGTTVSDPDSAGFPDGLGVPGPEAVGWGQPATDADGLWHKPISIAGICDSAQSSIISRWPPEPAVVRVVHGVPFAVDRVRCLGNAVVPAQAAHAWRILWGEVMG